MQEKGRRLSARLISPLLAGRPQQTIIYSLLPGADLVATDIQTESLGCRYRLWQAGRHLGTIRLPLTGSHYVLNSLAACAVGSLLALPFSAWQQGLATLGQIHRRCQVKGEAKGILVMDDYGHHPTEIATTLGALAQAFPERRLVVAFQPHRYSRTKGLFNDFATAFYRADVLILTDIYAASEQPIKGVSSATLLEAIRQHGHRNAHHHANIETLPADLIDFTEQGDLVLTLGAGNVVQVGEQLLQMLKCTGHCAPVSCRRACP